VVTLVRLFAFGLASPDQSRAQEGKALPYMGTASNAKRIWPNERVVICTCYVCVYGVDRFFIPEFGSLQFLDLQTLG